MATALVQLSDVLRHVKPGPRYTSYPPATAFVPGFRETAAAQELRAVGEAGEPISLYVHIPFCPRLCWYCGCNVVISRNRDGADAFVEDLERELDLVARALGRTVPMSELALGGGSPNWLPAPLLTRLFGAIAGRFPRTPDAELSVELDPRETTPEQIDTLAALGVTRISVGVQDFDPVVQEAIHRIQSLEQTRAVIDRARSAGIRGVNVDLIYGLPRQTPASFDRTLHEVVGLGPSRIAVFGYAHLPDVRPHQRLVERGGPLPDVHARARLVELAFERFHAAGYESIGFDHFALPGDGLAVAARNGTLRRCFQGYVPRRSSTIIGIGPSAISDAEGAYWQNATEVPLWTESVRKGELPVVRGLRLTVEDRLRRRVIMALMCEGAVDFAAVEAGRGSFETDFAGELAELGGAAFVELVVVDHGRRRIVATPLGRLLVRNIAMVFDRSLLAGARFSATL